MQDAQVPIEGFLPDKDPRGDAVIEERLRPADCGAAVAPSSLSPRWGHADCLQAYSDHRSRQLVAPIPPPPGSYRRNAVRYLHAMACYGRVALSTPFDPQS